MRTAFENTAKFFRLLTHTRSSYPREIQIEVTNACNLKCAMCPHTLGTVPQRDFPYELFQQMLQENPSPSRLVLTGWGEPLMHPHIFDMIAFANNVWHSCQVRFTTNGILLNQENQKRIFELNLSAITVSVDCWPGSGTWSSRWEDIMHPPSPKTHRNIQEYLNNHELTAKTPLILQSIVVEENVDDLRNYIQFLSQYKNSSINLVRLQQFPGTSFERMNWETEQSILSDLVEMGAKLGVNVRTLNQQSHPIRWATHFDKVCMKTDDSMYINVDGTCTPCCNLRSYAIGSLTNGQSSLQSIWNSDREKEFFHDQDPVCGKCDALFHKYHD